MRLLISRHLENFLALYDARNMHLAAQKKGISQPALSKSLKVLEESLGATLFERTHRGLDAMGEALGVNISVVSTPGAGGTKAFLTAMEKPADGYTIFDGYVAPLVLQPMLGKADWSYKDFSPLWAATSNSFAIAVRKDDDRFADFPALIAYAKANPGKLRYSPGTVGALPHMVAAKVMQTSDVVAQVVPYPEIDNAVKDLRSGILDFVVINPGVYNTNKDEVRVLAVLSELEGASKIYGGAPRVEDFGIELGMRGLAPMGWNWWLVRKDT